MEFQSGAFLHFWFVSAGPFDAFVAFVAFVALRASRVSRFLSDYKFDQICMYVKSLYAILRVFACFRTARNLRRAHLRPRALHR